MKAFDTDILTEILTGNPASAERIALADFSPISQGSCQGRNAT